MAVAALATSVKVLPMLAMSRGSGDAPGRGVAWTVALRLSLRHGGSDVNAAATVRTGLGGSSPASRWDVERMLAQAAALPTIVKERQILSATCAQPRRRLHLRRYRTRRNRLASKCRAPTRRAQVEPLA